MEKPITISQILTSVRSSTIAIKLPALFTFCLLALFTVMGNSQNVIVTPGGGTYATLKEAFDAINAGNPVGGILVEIVANTTETASAVLNASGVGAASYSTVHVQPSGGVSISVTGSIAGALIDLNGADNVTIDGLNSGGNSLSIINTSTGAASVIRFIGDASNNVIQNTILQGSASTASNGVVLFSSGTTTGNDGNNINNTRIGPAGSNLPVNGIFSLGTSAAIDNSGNTINGNLISDYFSASLATAGISLSTGNSAWNITSNKLYQTANRIFTTANTHMGISVGFGSGYTISHNTIGFANPAATVTTNLAGVTTGTITGTFPSAYTLAGVTLNATRYIAINCAFTVAGTVSEIQNNTIGGFALLTSHNANTANGNWCGINVTSGNANIGTSIGNTIGATSGLGSVYTASSATAGHLVGIYATTTNSISIENNTLGALEAVGTTATVTGGFTGIDVAGTPGLFTINNNTIG